MRLISRELLCTKLLRSGLILVGLLSLLSINGCSNVQAPVGSVGKTPATPKTVQKAPSPPQQQTGPQVKPALKPTPSPAVASKPSSIAPNNGRAGNDGAYVSKAAVKRLLDQAWKLRASGEYDRSNAVAERAMRIDRADPQLYLVMAKNYIAMARMQLAEQIARQGLSLVASNNGLKSQFHRLVTRAKSAP